MTHLTFFFFYLQSCTQDEYKCPKEAHHVGAAWPEGEVLQCVNAEGIAHGPSVSWHPNGSIGMKSYFINGKEHGTRERFFPNGKHRSINSFRNGVYDGLQRQWNQEGDIIASFDMFVGNGLFVELYDDGSLKHIIEHKKDGRRWIRWSEEGVLLCDSLTHNFCNQNRSTYPLSTP